MFPESLHMFPESLHMRGLWPSNSAAFRDRKTLKALKRKRKKGFFGIACG
jgi:hypothetical protein